jgi:hypothetical protein
LNGQFRSVILPPHEKGNAYQLPRVKIRQLFISPGHNYFGHHGQSPDTHAIVEVDAVECVAGRGIRGDRFFDYKPDYTGQITFFAWEVLEAASSRRSPAVSRAISSELSIASASFRWGKRRFMSASRASTVRKRSHS